MKEKINEIAQTLIDATNSGDLVWHEVDINSKKREYDREMFSIGEDGTRFEVPVRYSLYNCIWVLETGPSMWIKNKDLPNGSYYVHGNLEIVKLRDLLKSKFCDDMSPETKSIEDKLDSICKNISVSTYRDSKLEKILKIIKS